MIETIRANYAHCLSCPKLVGPNCTAGVIPKLAAALAFSSGCPLRLFPPLVPGQVLPPPVSGPELWHELHSERTPTPEWFAAWLAKVRRLPGCSCSKNFDAILRMWPPDFSGQDEFWTWGWRVHNIVSASLTPPKPAISLDAARKMYGR